MVAFNFCQSEASLRKYKAHDNLICRRPFMHYLESCIPYLKLAFSAHSHFRIHNQMSSFLKEHLGWEVQEQTAAVGPESFVKLS